MSETVFFRSVRIAAFRGFRDPREISLDASTVIVSGANGTGKTSFFDAIQWLLLGEVGRLRALRKHKNDEYIVNQYSLPGPASVEATVVIDGEEVRISRSGTHASSLLDWKPVDGKAASGDQAEKLLERALTRNSPLDLETVVLTSGLLQQDVMRDVLEARPKEHYEYLSQLLGLGSLERFEELAKQRASELAGLSKSAEDEERRTQVARDGTEAELHSLEQRAAARRPVEAATAKFQELLDGDAGTFQVKPGVLSSAEDLALLASSAKELAHDLEEAVRERVSIEASLSELAAVEEAELEGARAEVAERQETEREQQAAFDKARIEERAAKEASDQISQLASLAIPLLSSKCPVCRQNISPEEVAEDLRARAEDTEKLLATQRSRQRVEAALAEQQQVLVEARRKLAELESAVRSRVQLERRQEEIVRRAFQRLGGVERLEVSAAAYETGDPALLSAFATKVRSIAEAARELSILLRLAQEYEGAKKIRVQVKDLESSLREKKRRAQELRIQCEKATLLHEAVRKARLKVVSRRFRGLQPVVSDIYRRLDPHPTFRDIDFKHEIYWSRGTSIPIVRDTATEKEADPLLVFSCSQANIVALSYFLAVGQAAQDWSLPFLLLDDPLQSMDDVNALGFADLCRHITKGRQLVVATHERRLASLLERKLAPRSESESALALRFEGWDRSGPYVESRPLPRQIDEGRPLLVSTTA